MRSNDPYKNILINIVRIEWLNKFQRIFRRNLFVNTFT